MVRSSSEDDTDCEMRSALVDACSGDKPCDCGAATAAAMMDKFRGY